MGHALHHQSVKTLSRDYRLLLLVVLMGLVLLGARLRLRFLQAFPPARATYDEEAYLWVGKSLLTTGVPTSWSFVDYGQLEKGRPLVDRRVEDFSLAINDGKPTLANWRAFPKPLTKAQEIDVDGVRTHFTIVQPFLDHPPLGGIFFALFDRNRVMTSITTIDIRRVAVGLALVGLFGIFLLVKELVGETAAILAVAFSALGAGYVISSRLALPENILAAVWPWYLWLAYSQLKRPSLWRRNVLLAGALLLPLVKLSGLILPGSAALFYFRSAKHRWALSLLIGGAIGVLLYLAYGYFYDPASFKVVLGLQGARHFYGPQTVLLKILNPLVTAPLLDGFIFLGWFSFIALVFNRDQKESAIVTDAILAYLGFFLLFGGEQYPWYQFIVFPLLAMCAAMVTAMYLDQPSSRFNLLFFLIVLCPYLFYAFDLPDWTAVLTQFRLLALVFLVPLIFPDTGRRMQRINKILMLALLAGALYLSVRVINNAPLWWPI